MSGVLYILLDRPTGHFISDRANKVSVFPKFSTPQLSLYLRIAHALETGHTTRESEGTESIAVGSRHFVEQTKARLGVKASGRRVRGQDDAYELREPRSSYSTDFALQSGALSYGNTYLWKLYPEKATG